MRVTSDFTFVKSEALVMEKAVPPTERRLLGVRICVLMHGCKISVGEASPLPLLNPSLLADVLV